MTYAWPGVASVVGLLLVQGTLASWQAPGRDSPARDEREARQGSGRFQGEEGLSRLYDAILDASFDQVEAELGRACGPAPREACDVLAAAGVWWRILLDQESRRLDEEFSATVERAIRTTTAWTARSPESAEAWFYLGGAYAARVQWRVLRSEKLSAARDGKRIKDALERAIELDPRLEDAWFGIGMYRYYADVAPMVARILRFLLLLPGGDREEGLAQMLRAREKGRLVDGEADYQLHVIYLWYEQDASRALELLRGLQQRYPGNPLFTSQIAEIQDAYQHDIAASLASWRDLLTRARDGRVNEADLAITRARLGIAGHLDTLHQTDLAIDELEALVASKPAAPYSALALGYLRLGEAHDRLGHRDAALASYRRAVSAAPADDVHAVAASGRRRLRHAPDARFAEAYRLSVEGLRLLEDNDLEGAETKLSRSVALNPHDAVARHRYGRALAQRHEAAALDQFELALRDASACPAPILAALYLDGARLHERAANRERAIAWYRSAATLFGAAEDTRSAAARALTRLEK
jgi:tetratricopeptide (TPR) repeat protein